MNDIQKTIPLYAVEAIVEIKYQEAKEEMQKSLDSKDLDKWKFAEGKRHALGQLKLYIAELKRNLENE